jgi:hypothetical protein
MRVIALGTVRREVWDPGTKLRVVWGSETAAAEIATLPFVSAS